MSFPKLSEEQVGMAVQELKGFIDCAKFTHVEKGHTYFIRDVLKSKHPDTGEWYYAVLYYQVESKERFVRSLESFLENFIMLDEDIFCPIKRCYCEFCYMIPITKYFFCNKEFENEKCCKS